MALTMPVAKKRTDDTDPTAASVPGQLPTQVVYASDNAGSGGGAPQLTSPALAAGTAFGNSVRDLAGNAATGVVNTANNTLRLGTNISNVLSSPARAAGGFARDAVNAVAGAPASPNAGQSIAPYVAPQFTLPGAPATSLANVQGSAETTAAPQAVVPSTFNMDDARTLLSPFVAGMGSTGTSTGTNALTRPGAVPNNGAPGAGSPAVDSGVDINGNHLNYGAMVNGVPTFSDGTGGMARTMSDASIKDLANERSISRADVGSGANVLASDGLGYTPSTDQQVNSLVRNAQAPMFARPTAQQIADSDRNAIALRDPRSALGTAAHNLAMEAQYGGGAAARNASLNLDALTKGVDASGLSSQQAQQQSELEGQLGDQQLANTALQGRNQLADTTLQIRRQQLAREGQPVTLADGTLATRDPVTNVVTPSKMADGSPAKTLVARDDADTRRTNEIMDNIGKGAQELGKTVMPPPGAPPGWTPDVAALREQSARTLGLPIAKNPKSGQTIVNVNGQWMPL